MRRISINYRYSLNSQDHTVPNISRPRRSLCQLNLQHRSASTCLLSLTFNVYGSMNFCNSKKSFSFKSRFQTLHHHIQNIHNFDNVERKYTKSISKAMRDHNAGVPRGWTGLGAQYVRKQRGKRMIIGMLGYLGVQHTLKDLSLTISQWFFWNDLLT